MQVCDTRNICSSNFDSLNCSQLLHYNTHVYFHREHPVVFLVNNKMYTQRRLTQLYIYLSLAIGFGLPDHLQAFVLYTKSTHNW